MTPEGIKEEIKLNTEILKFLLIVLLATCGGMVTVYNIEKRNHVQQILLDLGWVFAPLLLTGILAHFLYIYSLLKKL
ncbi:MAG: hypothetical protein V5804_09475 [Mucilaginibacter sp.]|uniref:hypothetical protein n=1 Tax=Mucilaginibacter sp. TaxID=1882438 RepID=UPI0034E47A90